MQTAFSPRSRTQNKSNHLHPVRLLAWSAAVAACSLGLAARGQTLAEALDDPNLTYWYTGGDAPWYVQTVETHDGVSAARSGAIGDGQQTWLEVYANGPGTISFHWKVDSELGADFIEFSINGVVVTNTSGKNGQWSQVQVPVPPPTSDSSQTLRWRYVKDSSASVGQDAAWLDMVHYEEPPSFRYQPNGANTLPGDSIYLMSGASGLPSPAYQWQFYGTNLPGKTGSYLELRDLALSQAGPYQVVATNCFGSATSAVAIVVVRAPLPIQVLGTWSPTSPNESVQGLFVTNKVAYLADGTNGLAIIDVRDPAHCNRIGGGPTTAACNAVAVAGDYAYVADDTNGLSVYYVGDPAKCTRVGGCSLPATAYGVAVGKDAAFLVGAGQLHVVNVSNPSNCVYLATYPNGASGITVRGDFAFTASYMEGLQVLNISDPAHCVRAGYYCPMDFAMADVAIAGSHAFVVGFMGGFAALDISNPSNCIPLANFKPGGYKVAAWGNLAWTLTYTTSPRLEATDISNATNCYRISYKDLPIGGGSDVVAVDGCAYVANGPGGLLILALQQDPGIQFIPPSLPAPGQPFALRFKNRDGTTITSDQLTRFQVQYTETLGEWTNLAATLTLNDGVAQAQDPQGLGRPCRFYRVLVSP